MAPSRLPFPDSLETVAVQRHVSRYSDRPNSRVVSSTVAKARNAQNGLQKALDVTALIARWLRFLNLALGFSILVCAFTGRILDRIRKCFNAASLSCW